MLGGLTIRERRQIFHLVSQVRDVVVDTLDDSFNRHVVVLPFLLDFARQSVLGNVVNRHALLGRNKRQLVHGFILLQ